MMTNTKDKLNEAKYFLLQIQLAQATDIFRYNLTAFLSAARSVTLIMKKEFHDIQEFHDWYLGKSKFIETHGLLKYFLRQRNMSLHERPLSSIPYVNVQNQIDIGTRSTNIYLTGTAATLSYTRHYYHAPTVGTNVKYYFDDIKDRDVISVCQEVIKILEDIVLECGAKFEKFL